MDVEAEIRDLKRRFGELEGSFPFLTGQLRDVHRDLLGFQQGTEDWQRKADQRFDRTEMRLDRVETRLETLDGKVDELPRALAEVVRAEFDRRDRGG
jgi:hypothetical protein